MRALHNVGIDIGSTSTKVVVMEGATIQKTYLCPTGFSSVEASQRVLETLEESGFLASDCSFVATGYGRIAVPYAHKTITEITCHGRGADYLFGNDGVVIDIGGQDTKIITIEQGKVSAFVMNDKCSAGTGKFLEIMANRLAVSQTDLAELASRGTPTTISSLCTVFAESEVISLIGRGTPREDIAYGVVESVVTKVTTLASQTHADLYYLTGGLCENAYLIQRLQMRLGKPVQTDPRARFAGAIGAALCASSDKQDRAS